LREIDDELPVVLMTAFGTVQTAVQAIKLGAFDYITKPFEGDELIIAVKRAISHANVVRENALLRLGASQAAGLMQGADDPAPISRNGVCGVSRLIGDSPAMRRVKEQIHAVAESHATVLVCGESGAGKEVVARAIHDLSPRRDAPFLAVNCAALSESLLESELFGHERGAFTGADRLRKGRFELANGGTLLLDEVSEISPQLQAKLLRVLQERAFERVGSSVTIGVDVRIIATSNRDLPGAVAAGAFREDLFFRLNVLPIHLPPVRDRIEDVSELAQHFVKRFCARDGHGQMRFSSDATSMLTSYEWPGNVRELQNICERAVVLNAGAAGRTEIPSSLIAPWLG
ncbi:MAG: sigma-54-dependent transcriptional regulator, partial [Phycisphaerales bacterium]